jgi:hypothetical protein
MQSNLDLFELKQYLAALVTARLLFWRVMFALPATILAQVFTGLSVADAMQRSQGNSSADVGPNMEEPVNCGNTERRLEASIELSLAEGLTFDVEAYMQEDLEQELMESMLDDLADLQVSLEQ